MAEREVRSYLKLKMPQAWYLNSQGEELGKIMQMNPSNFGQNLQNVMFNFKH